MSNEKRFLWSPDGGCFVAVGDKCYWSDGSITGWPIRVGAFLNEPVHDDDFSAWSNEKRAAVAAEFAAKREAARVESERLLTILEKKVSDIEAKLTEDEIETLKQYYRE